MKTQLNSISNLVGHLILRVVEGYSKITIVTQTAFIEFKADSGEYEGDDARVSVIDALNDYSLVNCDEYEELGIISKEERYELRQKLDEERRQREEKINQIGKAKRRVEYLKLKAEFEPETKPKVYDPPK